MSCKVLAQLVYKVLVSVKFNMIFVYLFILHKIEHAMVMAMIASLPAVDLGKWEEVIKVTILLLGLDSAICRMFLDTMKLPFKNFAPSSVRCITAE